jgi:hypothetical protein
MAPVLRELVYGEVLQRKNVRPSVRGSARGRGREGSKRGSAGCSTASLPTIFGGGKHEFQRGIPLRWRRLQFVFQREMGEGE